MIKNAGRAKHPIFLCTSMLFLCLLLILTGVRLVSSQSPQDSLTIKREVIPSTGTLGEVEFAVSLELTGDSSQCQETVVRRPADIILVLDHSGSMDESAGGSSSGTKLDVLKEAVNVFLDEVNFDVDQVGLVEFDDVANVVHPLSTDVLSLREALTGIDDGGSTSIDLGVVMAHRELQGQRARKDVSHVMILLTDGNQGGLFASRGDPKAAARDARADDIRVITIGLGEDVDQDLLRTMASQPSDFYYAPNASDLERIYKSIAETISEPVGATDILIEHTYDATALEIIPGSIEPQGVINGDQISWNFKEVLDAPIQLTYKARPLVAGSFMVDRGDVVQYNHCGSEPREMTLPPGLPVSVAVPPTPTFTPSPTPSPTPTLTPTPRPTPTPTPTPTMGERVQQTTRTAFCNSLWWALCPGLLLLLFFIWWLKKLLEELSRPANERRPCKMIPWLLLPLLLILLSLIFSRLRDPICGARESVYFWRISPGSDNGQIYVTDKEGERPAQEFAEINRSGCSGCHAVTSTGHKIAVVAGGGVGDIIVYGLDGKRVAIPDVQGSYVAWAPDGEKLAVSTGDRDIVIIDLTRQTVTELPGASDPNVGEEMPAWSADGLTIAFVRGIASDAAWTFDAPCDIYVVPASGGTATPLAGASGDGFNYYPSYSPDGKWLAFTRHISGTTTYADPKAEIFIIPAAGGQRVRLAANDAENGTSLTNVSNSWPTWSLDSQWLAFNSKRNDDAYDLFITQIYEDGNSGSASSLASAANPGVFEHLPYWGVPPEVDPWPAILALWPCLLPFLLILLAWWLCKRLVGVIADIVYEPVDIRIPPDPLPVVSLAPLWQVAPTLIIGVGGTGRWVLTHIKKALRDGSGGKLPEDVKFVLLDTSECEETNVFKDYAAQVTGVEFAGVSLSPDEMLLMGQNLSSLMEALRTSRDVILDEWFPYNEYRHLSAPELDLKFGAHRRPLARAGLIQKLREGADDGKNTETEAAIAHNEASRLWDVLTENSEAVKDGKLVRIIVIGSLAGGMSGTLFDVAYLARLAARQVIPPEGNVHLEGYFATPQVFDNVAANQARLQVNAMAALRELQRFQLSEGFPFPMEYLSLSETVGEHSPSYLMQSCTWRLFDDITLFGDQGNLDRAKGKSDQPWATVFASMADVITFRMDRAINAGQAGDYRTGIRADIATKQANSGYAVASSVGSYVYRLPLVDILDIVHAQWAHKLFHVFLNGDVAGDTVSFDPKQAQMSVSAEEYAHRFVIAQHEAGDAPRGMRAVGYLAGGGEVLTRDILQLVGDEERPYKDYLAYALSLILNGNRASEAELDRRAPRLGYALAFLMSVEQHLQRAIQSAQAYHSGAIDKDIPSSWWEKLLIALGWGKASQQEWQQAIERIHTWEEITHKARVSIDDVKNQLIGDEQAETQGLDHELAVRQKKAEQRIKQMEQIAVRRYLWSQVLDTEEDWNDPENQEVLLEACYKYAEQKLSQYLGRFYWRMKSDGSMSLELVSFGKSTGNTALQAGNAKSVQRLADELLSLAVDATQDWEKSVSFEKALLTQFLSTHANPAVNMVEQIWPYAQPHLDFAKDANLQLDGSREAAVGLPSTTDEDTHLAALIEVFDAMGGIRNPIDRNLAPSPTRVIAATDRTAMTLIREYNLMPITNLPETKTIWKTYARNVGQEQDQLVEPSFIASVFGAERCALEYERRMESPQVINQDFRILHPLVVLALARADRAELYALAFAAGWIEIRSGDPWLCMPEEEPVDLTLSNVASGSGLDPQVIGLSRLAAGHSEDELLVDKLQKKFADPSAEVLNAWRRFIDQYRPKTTEARKPEQQKTCTNCGASLKFGAKFCGKCGTPVEQQPVIEIPNAPWRPPFEGQPQVVQDLAIVAALAAYRRLAPNDWDHLIMRRSRQFTS